MRVPKLEDYSSMKDFVLNVFFKTAIKYDVSPSDFWKLTPKTLEIIIKAKIEKQQEELDLQDLNNWRLGKYIRNSIGSSFSEKWKYPEKPMFSSDNKNELSEQEKQNERLKAQLFFSNLGDYVAIQKNNGE